MQTAFKFVISIVFKPVLVKERKMLHYIKLLLLFAKEFPVTRKRLQM